MCRVNACCCGCTLRTGAIVCCVFSGIVALYYLWSGAQGISAVNYFRNQGPPSSTTNVDDWNTALNVLFGISGFLVFSGALSAVAFIFILLGIIKEKSGLVMVWLIIEMIHVVCNGIISILFFAVTVGYTVYAVSYVFGCSISIYLWIVVLSYYHELNEGSGGQQSTGYPAKGVV